MKWGKEDIEELTDVFFTDNGDPKVGLLENVFRLAAYAFIGKTVLDLFSDLFGRSRW